MAYNKGNYNNQKTCRGQFYKIKKGDHGFTWRSILFGILGLLLVGCIFSGEEDKSEKASVKTTVASAVVTHQTKENMENSINGFVIPEKIMQRIDEGTWTSPADKSGLEKLIVDQCPFDFRIGFLKEVSQEFDVHNWSMMESESASLIKWLNPEHMETRKMLLGTQDFSVAPGDIDPKQTIIIAHFGTGNDSPIALDYRKDQLNPSVIMMFWGEDPMNDNRWKKIADSFEEFEKAVWAGD